MVKYSGVRLNIASPFLINETTKNSRERHLPACSCSIKGLFWHSAASLLGRSNSHTTRTASFLCGANGKDERGSECARLLRCDVPHHRVVLPSLVRFSGAVTPSNAMVRVSRVHVSRYRKQQAIASRGHWWDPSGSLLHSHWYDASPRPF